MMFRVLFLTLALVFAQAGPGVAMSFSIPLRRMRPYPTLLVKLGVAPIMADFTPANSAAFATAITNATGGDTITLTAGTTYTGPFTLKSGLTSTVTIRSSNQGSLPGTGKRVASGDRSNMPIIVCSNFNNDPCFHTTGTDADNWRLTGLDLRQASGVTQDAGMIVIGDAAHTVSANTPNNIEIDHNWLEATEANATRGLFLNGRNINVHDNYISGFRREGIESQAIMQMGGPGPVTIDNNYLSSVGEVFMSGGGAAGILPGDLTFTRNFLEAPQKYNPWNPSAFDTRSEEHTSELTISS